MKYFAVCPFCGKKLCKAEEGSKVEMQCPACHEQVEVSVAKGSVIASKCTNSNTQPHA